jgi:hypothetical protein
MGNQEDAKTLRQIATMDVTTADAATLNRIAAALESDAKRFEDSRKLQDIGRGAFESIADMVAALECDYDRLNELREERADWLKENPGKYLDPNDPRATAGAHWALAFPDEAEELAELETAAGDCEDREDAERRIQEDPLSIELSGKWSPGETPVADKAYILLGTGGPATRIVCELDDNMEPHRAWVQAQDWFLPWTDYTGGGDSEALLTYCRQFYFGEG